MASPRCGTASGLTVEERHNKSAETNKTEHKEHPLAQERGRHQKAEDDEEGECAGNGHGILIQRGTKRTSKALGQNFPVSRNVLLASS